MNQFEIMLNTMPKHGDKHTGMDDFVFYSGAIAAWTTSFEKSIREALSEMARMQKENLVIVPRDSDLDMRRSGLKVAENIKHWDWIAVSEVWDDMIAASQEKK